MEMMEVEVEMKMDLREYEGTWIEEGNEGALGGHGGQPSTDYVSHVWRTSCTYVPSCSTPVRHVPMTLNPYQHSTRVRE